MTDPLTDDRLAAIKARLAASSDAVDSLETRACGEYDWCGTWRRPADAEFVEWARRDVRALVAEVIRLRGLPAKETT